MPDPELEQAIRDNASQPAKAAVDGQSVEQHPLKDQIEADRYLASKDARGSPASASSSPRSSRPAPSERHPCSRPSPTS